MQIDEKKNGQKLIIGYAIFNKHFGPSVFQSVRIKPITRFLSSQVWRFDQDEFQDYGWKDIYPFIEQAKCTKLRFFSCFSDESFTCQIVKPFYSTLVSILIHRCQITNLQWIAFINSEQLKELDLCLTLIDKFKPIHKTYFKNLQNLSLVANRFSSFSFNRVKMNDLCSKFFILQKSAQQDVSIMAKCQFKKIMVLLFSECKRQKLPQLKTLISLQEKNINEISNTKISERPI